MCLERVSPAKNFYGEIINNDEYYLDYYLLKSGTKNQFIGLAV